MPGLGEWRLLTDTHSRFPESACGVYFTVKLLRFRKYMTLSTTRPAGQRQSACLGLSVSSRLIGSSYRQRKISHCAQTFWVFCFSFSL